MSRFFSPADDTAKALNPNPIKAVDYTRPLWLRSRGRINRAMLWELGTGDWEEGSYYSETRLDFASCELTVHMSFPHLEETPTQ